MKTAVILVLLCLSVGALAESSKFKSQLTNMLHLQAKAVDAVDSALNLLRDLKQANIDAQAAADELNRTQEAEYGAQIADLTFIADTNKAAGDAATEHRKQIQVEIAVTQEYLTWINNRRQEINRRRGELQEQRCFSNMMLVKKLKEHDEALKVIAILKEEIADIVEERTGQVVDFAQIKEASSKLSAYSHLFNDQQMKAFAQLTQENPAQAVDAETAEFDDRANDNDREALEVESMEAGTEKRNVGQRFYDMVEALEEHLKESIKNLEESEIRAAWDLVRWLQDSEEELIFLDVEQEKNTAKIDKLLIAIIAAEANEDRLWEIYFESASTLNTAIDNLNALRAAYMAEKARRDEENLVLDEVIQIFLDKVSTMDSGIRTKTDDHAQDGEFSDETDIARSTDAIKEKDEGRLAENVAAESNE